MSSRARRRLQQDPVVLKVNREEDEDESLVPSTRTTRPTNPFSLVGASLVNLDPIRKGLTTDILYYTAPVVYIISATVVWLAPLTS